MPVQVGGGIVEDGVILTPTQSAPPVAPTIAPPPVAPTAPQPSVDLGGDVLVPPGVNPRAPQDTTVIVATPSVPVAPPPAVSGGDLGGDVLVPPGVNPRAPQDTTVIIATPSVPVTPGTQPQQPGTEDAQDVVIPGLEDGPSYANEDGSNQTEFLVAGDFPDLDGLTFLADTTLRGADFVNFVRNGSEGRGLDPLAVFANAWHEGLGGGIGDNGSSYGPWQLHDGGGLPRKYWGRKKNDPAIQSWAWTRAGVNYALDSMAKTPARGETGDAAVHDLVFYFERPADLQQQYVIRLSTYYALKDNVPATWTLLAQRAKGPTASSSAPINLPVAPSKPTGIIAGWRGLLDVLGVDVPAAGTKLQNTARRLEGVVS